MHEFDLGNQERHGVCYRMKILLTGTSGFIGQHLVDRLLTNEGIEIWGLERYMTARWVMGQHSSVNTVFADLTDYAAVKKAVKEVSPDYVIHLAAISPVAYSYDHPQEVTEVDYLGTINLAEACLHEVPHIKQFIFASTTEIFGNAELPFVETTESRANSPYACAKYAATKYLEYMHEAYEFPVTICIPCNTYGRKDNTHFFVEKCISQMLNGSVVKLGDPDVRRDLMYVDDHVSAYLSCLQNQNAIGQRFIFSTGKAHALVDVVEIIKKHTSFTGKVLWNQIPKRPLDIIEIRTDPTKARQLLGWRANVQLDAGIKQTVDHWRTKLAVIAK